jgi:hypothetical protein
VVVALSLALSAWLIAIDPIVTRDAIIYLRAAQAYLQDGFFASQQVFGRPFLSVLVAIVHQITGLSLVHAGLLLNSLFYALLCAAFVDIVRRMNGSRRVQIFAVVVILSQPVIGDYRSSIMRDPAFWACMLMAFRALLLYTRGFALGHQVQWFAWILGAALFRFEGLFFAALAPLALLFAGDRMTRWRACVRLLVPQLILISALLVSVWIYQQVVDPGARLFPAIEKYLRSLVTFPDRFAELAADTGEVLLRFTAREDAAVATLAGLFAILLLNICRAICWPWVLVLLWGWHRDLCSRVSTRDAVIINAHLLISLLYLSLYLVLRQFVLERYVSIFALFVLLYVPFILDALWSGARGKFTRFAVVAVLLGMSADMLHNHNYRKAYIHDAAQWLAENTADDASLLTNDRYIAYFSNKQLEWARGKPVQFQFDVDTLARQPDLWRGVDYLAVSVPRRQVEQWQTFVRARGLTEIAVFDGGRMGLVAVVKLSQNS